MGGAALRVPWTLVHHIAARTFSPWRWLAEQSRVEYLMASFSTKLQQLLICVTSLYRSWFMGFFGGFFFATGGGAAETEAKQARNEMEGRSVLLTSRGKSSRLARVDLSPVMMIRDGYGCLSFLACLQGQDRTGQHGYPFDADAA